MKSYGPSFSRTHPAGCGSLRRRVSFSWDFFLRPSSSSALSCEKKARSGTRPCGAGFGQSLLSVQPPSTAALVIVAWWNLWYYWAMMYLVPALLAGFMQSLRKYIEHMGLMGSTILESTRSVVSTSLLGRLLAFTMFNEPYHGVHHKYARLPQTALPEFTELLVTNTKEEVPPFPSYYHAFCDMVRSLGNPRIGAQWRAHEVASPPEEQRTVCSSQRFTSPKKRSTAS